MNPLPQNTFDPTLRAIDAVTYPQQEVAVLPIGKVIITQVGSRQEHVIVRDTGLDVRDRLGHPHTMRETEWPHPQRNWGESLTYHHLVERRRQQAQPRFTQLRHLEQVHLVAHEACQKGSYLPQWSHSEHEECFTHTRILCGKRSSSGFNSVTELTLPRLAREWSSKIRTWFTQNHFSAGHGPTIRTRPAHLQLLLSS